MYDNSVFFAIYFCKFNLYNCIIYTHGGICLIVLIISRFELNLDIVVGKATEHVALSFLKKYETLLAKMLVVERKCLLVREFKEYVRAAFLLLFIYYIRDLQRGSARTFAVWEDVKLRYVEAFQKLIALFKALWSLAATAHHHINADESIRHVLLDKFYLMAEECCVVAAVHKFEHSVRPALERNVEVRHELFASRAIYNNVIREQFWLNTAYAIALNTIHFVKRFHKIEECFACGTTEITDVHASDDNLLAALLSHLLCLVHEELYGSIARKAASVRYSAVGAEVVAAVLNLQEEASAVAA